MIKIDLSKTIYNQLASAALDEIKDHPHTEDEIRWYLSGIAFVAANFHSIRDQIRQEEREACAKICDEIDRAWQEKYYGFHIGQDSPKSEANKCAEAIRKRGEK